MQVKSDEKVRVAWLAHSLASTRIAPAEELGLAVALGAADGDDCGVLSVSAPADIVIGTDYVRGPKFRLHELGLLSDRDVARFCVTANVSDVAAMGAVPVAYLAVVRYPSGMTDDEFREIMAGIDEACTYYNCALLGGDTGSAERLILSGTAIGVVKSGGALVRSASLPGDLIGLTGPVGGAGAAVLAADAGVHGSMKRTEWEALLGCWTTLTAQPKVGTQLAGVGARIACQDVSDGLLATLRELSEQSHNAFIVDEDQIPIALGVADVAALLGVDGLELAMSASTDFCLCLTFPPEQLDRVAQAVSDGGSSLSVVGHVEEGVGVWLDSPGRERRHPTAVEWKHQDVGITQLMLDGLGAGD